MFTFNWQEQAHNDYNDLKIAAEKSFNNRKKNNIKKSSKQEGLFKQVRKALDFLSNNPKHPSLKTHEYSSIPNPFDSEDKVWEAYAQNKTPGAYRIFWCYGPGKKIITIIAITPHP